MNPVFTTVQSNLHQLWENNAPRQVLAEFAESSTSKSDLFDNSFAHSFPHIGERRHFNSRYRRLQQIRFGTLIIAVLSPWQVVQNIKMSTNVDNKNLL